MAQQQQQQQHQQPEQQQPGAFVTISPPVAAFQVQSEQPPRARYKQAAGRFTAYIQIICGLASIVFGVCVLLFLFGIIRDPSLHWGHVIFGFVGWPIWSGVIFVITGSIGACAKAESRCLITGYLVMCIIASIIAAGQLIWESFAAVITNCYDHPYYYDCPKPELSYGMHVGAVVAAVVELFAAITGSVFCCHGMCCGAQPPQGVVQHVQYTQYAPQSGVVTHASQLDPGSYPSPSAPGLYPSVPEYTPVPEPLPPGYSFNPTPTAPPQTYMDTGLPGK